MQIELTEIRAEGSAKILRPSASKIVRRKRLFRRFETDGECPLVWVSGPPGSGKTTLVSSYIENHDLDHLWYNIDSSDIDFSSFYFNLALACKRNGRKQDNLPVFTPEYRLNITGFNHIFFNALFNCFAERSVIVLDNYHELPEELTFHDLLLDAIGQLPKNLRVIIISRQEPSSKFSRLKANRRINLLGWRDLRFTPEEFIKVAYRWGFEDLPEKTQNLIYQKMDGWIAGLLFMLDGTKKDTTNLQHISSSTFEEIFQYLAEETYEYQDEEVKKFLLQTSLLPVITAGQVPAQTGETRTNKILAFLHRNNLFIERLDNEEGKTYQYHPLFQKYLQHKMVETFTPQEVAELKRETADLLLEEKQTEKAAELLLTAQDFDRFTEIVVCQAPILIAQGRLSLLEEWLACISADKFQDNPWLSYWYGICMQQIDQMMAKEYFKKAFEISCSRQDMECAFSALAGLVDTIIHQYHDFTELDPLIDWFEAQYGRESEELSGELQVRVTACMVEALLIRNPANRNLTKWVKYVSEKVLELKDIELTMQVHLAAANYYFWTGNRGKIMDVLGKMQNLTESPRVSPLDVLKSKCLEATIYAWFMADAGKCMEIVDSALDIARSTGIHLMDRDLYFAGAFGALIAKKLNRMAEYLHETEAILDNAHQHSFFCYYYLSAWYSIAKGNFSTGKEHADSAVKITAKTGHVFHRVLGTFVLSLVLFEKGDFRKSLTEMHRFEKDFKETESSLFQYIYLFSKALLSFDIGKEEVGGEYLKKALQLGRQEQYQNLSCWWNRDAMSRLCMKALERKIEVKYVKEIISFQGITPIESPVEIEHWPWLIRIYTLGRFEIVKDGKPVRFTGKAQQKPMAMMKALIALGGRGVSEEYLSDALWPDADGDMQHQSLATTLHRLRKILGDKDLVDFQGGHLSINPRYVWVDIWAFERLLSKAETELKKNEKSSVLFASQYAEKAIRLYNGGFLPQNNMDPWCIHIRERLKSRFMRGVTLLGRSFEKLEERQKAVDCYLYALEIDPMIEEFHQRLMICYHRMGRIADAVLVYKRCKKNLFSLLQVSPSSHTRSIYKNLQAKSIGPEEPSG